MERSGFVVPGEFDLVLAGRDRSDRDGDRVAAHAGAWDGYDLGLDDRDEVSFLADRVIEPIRAAVVEGVFVDDGYDALRHRGPEVIEAGAPAHLGESWRACCGKDDAAKENAPELHPAPPEERTWDAHRFTLEDGQEATLGPLPNRAGAACEDGRAGPDRRPCLQQEHPHQHVGDPDEGGAGDHPGADRLLRVDPQAVAAASPGRAS